MTDIQRPDPVHEHRPEDGVALSASLQIVLADVTRERAAQDALWGLQEFPDGTGPAFAEQAEAAKAAVTAAWNQSELTWREILAELTNRAGGCAER